jgi:hypothetical protein
VCGTLATITGFFAIYLVFYEHNGLPPHGPPLIRPGWSGTIALAAICAVAGGFGFSKLAAVYIEGPDYFNIHAEVWKEPCTDTEGPRLLTERGSERQRFLCRFKVSQYAAEVFVVDYLQDENMKGSVPLGSDPQVQILERGEWTGPKKTHGPYIKYTLQEKDDIKKYARYWLQEKGAPVVVISSMDTKTKPSAADFTIAREALLAKRYHLSKSSSYS